MGQLDRAPPTGLKRGKHSLPLSATPKSSIGMAVVNINGLLLDADLQKTDTPVYVNNSNRRCMAVNAASGLMGIFCSVRNLLFIENQLIFLPKVSYQIKHILMIAY